MFSVKEPVPFDLRSRVVYKFLCAGCKACYIGETSRHLSTRVREHLSGIGIHTFISNPRHDVVSLIRIAFPSWIMYPTDYNF